MRQTWPVAGELPMVSTSGFLRSHHARLAAELKTPIQIGGNFYGPRDLHKALQRQACDLAMPDLMRIGGVTGWPRAAAICGAAGVPMSRHHHPEVAAHLMRVTETVMASAL